MLIRFFFFISFQFLYKNAKTTSRETKNNPTKSMLNSKQIMIPVNSQRATIPNKLDSLGGRPGHYDQV